MCGATARVLLAAACFALAALVWVMSAPSKVEAASGTVVDVLSDTVTCRPFNLLDAGLPLTDIKCGGGFGAIMIETESATPAYICGQGATAANYTSKCRKRCVGCMNGSMVSDDALMRSGATGLLNYRCVSGTADAGVVLTLTCAH